MSRISVIGIPSQGSTIHSFRIAGRSFKGRSGGMDVSPTLVLDRKPAPAVLVGGESVELELRVVGRYTGMAFRNSSFGWATVPESSIVDGAELEGRDLIVSWSHKNSNDDCWLMLGDQPFRAQPEIIRRQNARDGRIAGVSDSA